ncbi:hypothetical protein J1N35_016165 [Gossypium stocksii]|uniref:Uncharacterized protein n=1 Tax=Gossypium stocksii TaxID=47602 RepID=A0A9D4AB21_9ROSI|nr:hypothetical protein J1N35_016165 [Gossypium stocksii]
MKDCKLIFQRVKSTVLGSIIVEVTGLKIGKLPVRIFSAEYSFSLLKSSSSFLWTGNETSTKGARIN